MLKEKREFEIGDKVVVLGCQDGLNFLYKVGTVLTITGTGMIGIEFEFYNNIMHSCGGLGEYGYCFKITNLMNRKIRRVSIFEYNEKELENALEEFNNRRYSSKHILGAKRNICNISNGNCDSCPLYIFCHYLGTSDINMENMSNLLYNSFVNIAKEELEHEHKK